ncbi:hypothetical protein B0T13DRAFT_446833 [Neurospora crassa]|nr:hypothetical protein B0T13DRAFT_446833 [Neurospora crassa]
MTEEAADTVLETGVETRTALTSDDNGQRSDSPVLRNRAKRAFFRVWIPDQTRPEALLDLNTSKHGISSLWSWDLMRLRCHDRYPLRGRHPSERTKELGQCDSDSSSSDGRTRTGSGIHLTPGFVEQTRITSGTQQGIRARAGDATAKIATEPSIVNTDLKILETHLATGSHVVMTISSRPIPGKMLMAAMESRWPELGLYKHAAIIHRLSDVFAHPLVTELSAVIRRR